MRAGYELWARGITGVGLAVAAIGWWAANWLTEQDVSALRSALGMAAVGVVSLLAAGVVSIRRLRAGRDPLPPPPHARYEPADIGRERRLRLAGIVVFGVIVLLAFDRLTGGSGEMAGLVAGLFGPVGLVDLLEARTWRTMESERDGRGLYLLVRPHALMAGIGVQPVYERPDDPLPPALDERLIDWRSPPPDR